MEGVIVSAKPGTSASDTEGGQETVYKAKNPELPILGHGFTCLTGRRKNNEDRFVAVTNLHGYSASRVWTVSHFCGS
jgi:hypothetical protein